MNSFGYHAIKVISRLREARWTHVRQTDKVIFMRQEGSCHKWMVNILNKDTLCEDNVRTIFRQAEFPSEGIERFFDAATPV